MRLLRLGNSADAISSVPDEGRAYRIVERLFFERTGEPMETTFKRIGPRPALATIVDRWIAEHQPSVALLILNQYWYGYPSAPKRLRAMGPVGKVAGRAGYLAARRQWLVRNRAYRLARRLFRRTVGSSFMFEPAEVVESMSGVIRMARERHPEVVLAVWSEPAAVLHDGDRARGRQLLTRREAVHAPLRALCDELDVPYSLLRKPENPVDWRLLRDADHLHLNAAGHQYLADAQIDLVLEAWRRANAGR